MPAGAPDQDRKCLWASKCEWESRQKFATGLDSRHNSISRCTEWTHEEDCLAPIRDSVGWSRWDLLEADKHLGSRSRAHDRKWDRKFRASEWSRGKACPARSRGCEQDERPRRSGLECRWSCLGRSIDALDSRLIRRADVESEWSRMRTWTIRERENGHVDRSRRERERARKASGMIEK
jgi:hypothetical protein